MPRLILRLRDWLTDLDALLRGDRTRPDATGRATLDVSVTGLIAVTALLAMFYGACMGSFSLFKSRSPELIDPFGGPLQWLASIIKTPALFFVTLIVTLPSLYVASALAGSRLDPRNMARLLSASLAINVAVLASLGTIVLFFSLTTDNYPFVVLLNVAAFSVAGLLGLLFLLQTLHRVLGVDPPTAHVQPTDDTSGELVSRETTADEDALTVDPSSQDTHPQNDPDPPNAADPGPIEMPTGDELSKRTRIVFRCWLMLFCLVGAQTGWVLRPFIGSPDRPFTLLRERDSNFFGAVADALRLLLLGD